MSEKRKKILIADSSPLYREGLKIALRNGTQESKFTFYEAESDYEVFFQIKNNKKFDLVILDETLLIKNYYSLKYLISDTSISVLLMSSRVSSVLTSKARSLGAKGIICKSGELPDVYKNVNNVLGGGNLWVEESVQKKHLTYNCDLYNRLENLTDAQRIVLRHLTKGLMNKQIAYELGIQENTVKAHVSRILRKLKFSNRTELVIAINKIQLTKDPVIKSPA